MFCKHCGKELPIDSVYCNACGKKTNDDSLSSSDSKKQNPIIPRSKKTEVTIANEVMINLKLIVISIILGGLTYFILRVIYYQSFINEVKSDYIPFCEIIRGYRPSMGDAKLFMASNADKLSQDYSLKVFLISIPILIIGRYLIKSISWAQKTSKK